VLHIYIYIYIYIYAISSLRVNVIIIDVIRGDTGTFLLKNILLAFTSEMCHLSDGSPCGIESSTNLRYSRILFECLSFTVSCISPQMFHGLHQESVDAVGPCDTAVLRELMLEL